MYKFAVLILVLISSAKQNEAASFPVQRITIIGNAHTKDFVILREMLVQVDSMYSETGENNIVQQIQLSSQRILNLNLFNDVDITYQLEETERGYGYTIAVEVVEKWFIWPIPFVEFSDRNFNVWSNFSFDPERTNYGFYVFSYNLFGRNHTMKTKLKTGYNTKIGIEYCIPFLSKRTNWGLNALVEHATQNEVWYETRNDSLRFFRNKSKDLVQSTQARLELTKRITPFTRVYYGVNFEYGQLDTSVPINDYFINNLRFQRKFGLYFGIDYDKRNNIYYPTDGDYGSFTLQASQWQNNGQLTNVSAETRLQRFSQLSGKWSSALSLYVQYNTNDLAPYADRKLLGYGEIVRGYEHYVIDGTMGWKTNAALRYHLVEKVLNMNFIPIENYVKLPLNVYLEGYIDGGYAHYTSSHQSNALNGQPLYAVGMGINTLFYNDRLLRLEYSLNSLAEGGFFVHLKKAI